MATKIYITIEDQNSMLDILREGIGKGLFKNLQIDTIRELVEQKNYPILLPVELDNVLDLMSNPIVKKMFGSKIDKAVSVCLHKILETG